MDKFHVDYLLEKYLNFSYICYEFRNYYLCMDYFQSRCSSWILLSTLPGIKVKGF